MEKNYLKHLKLNSTGSGEEFFITKRDDGTIGFHVGYTECHITVKEAKEMINALKYIIKLRI